MRGSIAVALCVASACLLIDIVAFGHAVGMSRGDYVVQGSTIALTATFSRAELAIALPALEHDDAPPKSGYGDEARVALVAWLREGYRISSAGQSCSAGDARVDATEQDGVRVAMLFACPGRVVRFRVEASIVTALASGHRHLAHVVWEDGSRDFVSQRGATAFDVDLAQTRPTAPASADDRRWPAQLRTFVRMGVEHILAGYDHLLFVVGLLLVLGPLRSLVAAISAFTIAHSLTLGLATVGTWVPSPAVVEPLIALSIAYVGVENWFVTDAVGRWRLTLMFGLVHGFGFAGALREVAVPTGEMGAALLGFNLGVEAGQLAVVAVVLPILLLARSRGWLSPYRARLLSVPIAVVGVVWFVARLLTG